MELQELKVNARPSVGKGPSRRTRVQGLVPGVVYGGGKDPVHIHTNAREFQRLLHSASGEHAIVQLKFDEDAQHDSPALLKAIQHHPVRGQVVHADFLRIRLDEKISTSVAIKLAGTPVGVVAGGVLDVQLREVEIECLALEVPQNITFDISTLEIGDSVHVEQLTAPKGITIITEPDRTIAAVHAPRVSKAEAEAEAEVTADEVPEVGKEGAEEGADED
jgi:large subunit ribosomal protein L25